ncbi:uncharacterized protein [Lolium perenne]|uniref:uncharacterized protein n=1 Tax=Lolium perenne TaxID=4522 RepID=UPI003A99A32E
MSWINFEDDHSTPPRPSTQIADGSSASPLRIFALASIAFRFFFAKLQNQAKEGRFPNKNAFSACRGSLSHLSQRLNFYFWGVRSWFQVHYFASGKCRWLNLRCLFNIYDIVFEPPDSAFFWLSALEYYFI